MLTFPSALKIYLAVEPVDMRKQFNGLWALAEQKLREDPRLGAVFVFTNKSRDRLKMLYWDEWDEAGWAQLAQRAHRHERGPDS